MMISTAVLIQVPSINFSSFLSLTTQALGYSPSSAADATSRILHDAEKFMSCLAAMKDKQASVGLSPHLLTHVSFSVLIVADERDMQDVLEYCSGMPFVITDTVARSIQASVVTGTLAEWRSAVISGCHTDVVPPVRALFNRILSLFEQVNLNVWKDCDRKQEGQTFLLEDHRGSQ